MRLLIISLFLILGYPGLSQFNQDTSISLITCDPGSEIYMLFGHSALRVKTGEKDLIYNYGTFDFRTPGFTLKFMRGKLSYMLSVTTYGRFLQEYHYDKRGVLEQEYIMSPSDKNEVIKFLEWNALPENAQYKYDFFFDNCSSRIRDIFNQVHNNQLEFQSEESTITYREMLHQYLGGYPWTEYGIDLIIGALADDRADTKDQMFLPDYLKNNLGKGLFNGKPILSQARAVLTFEEEKAKRQDRGWFTPSIIFAILIILWGTLLYFKKHKILKLLNTIVLVIIGLMSLVITFLWFGTDHLATKYNYNIIWLNPVIWVYFLFRNNSQRHKFIIGMMALTFMGILFSMIGLFPQEHPNLMFAIWLILVYSAVLSESKNINATV